MQFYTNKFWVITLIDLNVEIAGNKLFSSWADYKHGIILILFYSYYLSKYERAGWQVSYKFDPFNISIKS